MTEIYKLRNKVMHYGWGSPVDIPRLMGIAGNGEPWAELWIGAHSGAPSTAIMDAGETSLADLIACNPIRFLGDETARRYGALPFLLKLLAAEKPLSIQAHPNLVQAREGFERETSAGLALDSPERNYKDANHKPEIICALTPFTGLCGFRSVEEIFGLLNSFFNSAPPVLREGFVPLARAFLNRDPAMVLRDFLAGLFGFSQQAREALTEYILSICGRDCELELMRDLARLYPGDPAVIAPIYLNIFHLEPGEAVFLESGVLHAYIHGFGVELMANSDNVLRGGLTPKHVDVPELMKILEFKPFKPRIITPNASCFSYPTPCEEFSLTRICGVGGVGGVGVETWPIQAASSPSLCIVTEGELVIATGDRETIVKQGESLFIPPVKNPPLSLKGKFTLFIASCGRKEGTALSRD